LAAGQLGDAPGFGPGQAWAGRFEGLRHPPPSFLAWHAFHGQAEADVRPDGQVREQFATPVRGDRQHPVARV
jgi:hypothetical protein